MMTPEEHALAIASENLSESDYQNIAEARAELAHCHQARAARREAASHGEVLSLRSLAVSAARRLAPAATLLCFTSVL